MTILLWKRKFFNWIYQQKSLQILNNRVILLHYFVPQLFFNKAKISLDYFLFLINSMEIYLYGKNFECEIFWIQIIFFFFCGWSLCVYVSVCVYYQCISRTNFNNMSKFSVLVCFKILLDFFKNRTNTFHTGAHRIFPIRGSLWATF